MSNFSFLSKIQSQSKEGMYLVKGEDKGIKCWYYVDVPKLSDSLFKRGAVSGSKFDLETHGKIVVSGWGEEPHPHIIAKIEELGAYYKPEEDAEWQKILLSKSDIYFVMAKDRNGKDFHAYVAVQGTLADQFIKDAIEGDIDIHNYGEVVLIDWGYPTEETIQEMTDKYGVNHSFLASIFEELGQ